MESNFSPPFDKLVWRSERDRWRNEGRRLGKLDSIPLPLPPRAIIAHVEGKFVRGPGALASGSKNADVVPPPGSLRRPAPDTPSSVLVILDDEKESTRVPLTDRLNFETCRHQFGARGVADLCPAGQLSPK